MKIVNIILGIISFLIPFSSYAYDFEDDGIYYNITSQSDLEVEVTYKEHQYVYGKGRCNNSYEGDITIPSTVNYQNRNYNVTSIGKWAFGSGGIESYSTYYDNYGCKITSIILPQTIRKIDDYAFQNCIELLSINLPENLLSIGKYSFSSSSIESILIPKTTEEIGDCAFSSCKNINYVILGQTLLNLGDEVFSGCLNLLEVFYTSIEKPIEGYAVYSDCNSNLEKYVPSSKNYGFGKDYITFDQDTFEYSGKVHNINWTNNIKYLNCNISSNQTEVNVGDYTKILTASYSGDINFTVEILYRYEITPVPLTVTVNDQEREYGMPNPTFTSNVSGFVPGESLTSLGISPSYQCEATQTSNVGNYPIRAKLEASNYVVTYNYGNLTINKVPLSITVINSERQYGYPNPSFELSYSGLRNDENVPAWNSKPQFFTTASQTSNVGIYDVTISGADAVNYNIIQYNQGTLTILKRDLIAKAKDEVRLYGERNPAFTIGFSGFANGENSSVFQEYPKTSCSANSDSNVGTYPIEVSGGLAENYNFIYENGTLTIEPLTIGWEKVYNSVIYNDMSISNSDLYFSYIPSINGDFSMDDFWIELWFLDKDNKYGEQQNSINISSGEYAGTYIYTNIDRPMWAGKYILELKSKETNPNILINTIRCYLTVNTANTNLDWGVSSIIEVEEGQTIDLGISYDADMWCTFNTEFDSELISLSYENAQSNTPTWYVTGLKEGETTLYFSIECQKNDQGFYDFKDSSTLYKKVRVTKSSGNNDNDDNDDPDEAGIDSIYENNSEISIYTLTGLLIKKNCSIEDLNSLSKGIYIIVSGKDRYKISI